MPLRPSERIITISSSPVTYTLAIRMNELSPVIANGQTDVVDTYVITGTHTMGGNITIAPNATGVATGITFRFIYVADVTLGANTFQIFGYSMTAEQLLQNSVITARYNGSSWDVVLNSSFTENDIVATNHIINLAVTTAKINDLAVTTDKINDLAVTTSKIADTAVTTAKIALLNITTALINDLAVTTGKINDLAVTTAKLAANAVTNAKLAGMTRGTVKVGDSGGAASDLALGAANSVLMSDGTDPVWTDANSLPISNVVRYAEVDIPTAQVLTLNSVPVELVPAQGAGKSIVVIRAAWSMTYAGVAYATNTTLQLITATASAAQVNDPSGLAGTATVFVTMAVGGGGTTDVVANQPLNVSVATGDPTLGTSDIKVMVWYVVQES